MIYQALYKYILIIVIKVLVLRAVLSSYVKKWIIVG